MSARGGMRRSSSLSGRPSFGFHGPQRVPNVPSSGGGGTKVASALKRSSSQQSLCPTSAAKPRHSSIGSLVGLKDPRPFTDKVYREQMVRRLVESALKLLREAVGETTPVAHDFLVSHGYAYPINLKGSNGPSKADFKRIFEFLVGHLQRNFRIGEKDKLEDVVTNTLKMYCYPFTISKSVLSTIGVQHTWPPLLAALSYLRTCIQSVEEVDVDHIIFASSGGDYSESQAQIIHQYVHDLYRNFLAENDDECARLKKELQKKIDTTDSVQNSDVESVESEVTQLAEQLAMLESQPNQLLKLETEIRAADMDLEKLETYLASLAQCQHSAELALKQVLEQQQHQEEESESIAREVHFRNEVVKNQQISGIDAQRLNGQRIEIKAKLSQMEGELMATSQELLAETELYSEEKASVESEVEAFNKKAQMLQLVPRTAANAGDIDFEMKPWLSEAESIRYETQIRPALYMLGQRRTERCRQLQDKLQKTKDTLEHFCEAIVERRENCAEIEKATMSMDARLELAKEMHANEMKSLMSRIDEFNEIITNRRSQSAYETCKRLLQAEIERFDQEMAKQQARENTFCEYLIKLSQSVTEFKNHMATNLPIMFAEARAQAQ